MLVAEAAHSSHLRPALELCERHCEHDVPLCTYSAIMDSVGGFALALELDTPLEAVISQERWLASPRTRSELLRKIHRRRASQARHSIDSLTWLPRSACFVSLIDEPGDRWWPP